MGNVGKAAPVKYLRIQAQHNKIIQRRQQSNTDILGSGTGIFFSPFLSSEDSKPNQSHPRAQPHTPRLQLNRSKEMLTCTDSSPSPLGAVINLRGAGAPPSRRLALTTETARSDEEREEILLSLTKISFCCCSS